jgi:hypothetical protein
VCNLDAVTDSEFTWLKHRQIDAEMVGMGAVQRLEK